MSFRVLSCTAGGDFSSLAIGGSWQSAGDASTATFHVELTPTQAISSLVLETTHVMFVELFVSNTSGNVPLAEQQLLLPATPLSDGPDKLAAVHRRAFSRADWAANAIVAAQKWSFITIVCTQPYPDRR